MVSEPTQSVAEKAKVFYDNQLRSRLEKEQLGNYVAIEPENEKHYLGETFIDAAMAAKQAHPDQKSFVIRIGHEAAFHIGVGAS